MKKMITAVCILIFLVIISFSLEKIKSHQNAVREENIRKEEMQKKDEQLLSDEKRRIFEQLKNTRTIMAMFPVGTQATIVAKDTYFDYDADGYKEKTEWLGGEEGILVKDIGLDGKITSGAELFGDYSVLSGEHLFLRGFSMLSREDTNGDGIIDVHDKNFSLLKMWMDRNHNATVDDGELLPLASRGISVINLSYQNVVDENGYEGVRRRSQLSAVGKHRVVLEEIWVKVDPKDTIKPVFSTQEYVNSDVPDVDVHAFGRVPDLKDALYIDKKGILLETVKKYLSETDIETRKKYLPLILVAWAGKTDIDYKSRGDFYDSRKLETIESFDGRNFVREEEMESDKSNPGKEDVRQLSDKFQSYLRYLNASLSSMTFYKDMLNSIVYEYDNEIGRYDFSVKPVVEYFSAVYAVNPENGKALIYDFADVLRKIHENDDLGQKILSRISESGNPNGSGFEKLLFHIADERVLNFPEDLFGLQNVVVTKNVVTDNSLSPDKVTDEDKIQNKLEDKSSVEDRNNSLNEAKDIKTDLSATDSTNAVKDADVLPEKRTLEDNGKDKTEESKAEKVDNALSNANSLSHVGVVDVEEKETSSENEKMPVDENGDNTDSVTETTENLKTND